MPLNSLIHNLFPKIKKKDSFPSYPPGRNGQYKGLTKLYEYTVCFTRRISVIILQVERVDRAQRESGKRGPISFSSSPSLSPSLSFLSLSLSLFSISRRSWTACAALVSTLWFKLPLAKQLPYIFWQIFFHLKSQLKQDFARYWSKPGLTANMAN